MNTKASTLDRLLHFSRGKIRVVLSWVLIVALVLCVDRLPTWEGIVILFFGAFMRAIASGYIDKEGQLTVGGPYSFIRNPLYLGSILTATGAALAQHNVWLALLATVVLVLIHTPIMIAEERVLLQKFGDVYAAYQNTVPPLLPYVIRPWPAVLLDHPRVKRSGFSWQQFFHNRGYEAFFVSLGIVVFECAVFYLKQRYLGTNP